MESKLNNRYVIRNIIYTKISNYFMTMKKQAI